MSLRSLLAVWIEQRDREREKDELVEQTRLFREVGRKRPDLLSAQSDAFRSALSYERARLERLSLRPRDYLDAIREVPEAEPVFNLGQPRLVPEVERRALSGGQIGQPARFTEEQRGAGLLGEAFGAARSGLQGLTDYLDEAFAVDAQPPSQFESILGQRARRQRDEFIADTRQPSILQQQGPVYPTEAEFAAAGWEPIEGRPGVFVNPSNGDEIDTNVPLPSGRDPFGELTDPLGENIAFLGAAAEPFTRSVIPEPILEDVERLPGGRTIREQLGFATSPLGAGAM
ncbi:hypothetical protein LCGC14_2379440, partial [marine sediment metagenome]